jgi:hypothetical protein
MTVPLGSTAVEAARERDGGPASDRRDAVDEAVCVEKLGWQNGSPLVAESYSEYPDREDLTNPEYTTFIKQLFEHPLIRDIHDAVAELCGANNDSLLRDWREALAKAAEWGDIDAESAFENGDGRPDNPLENVLGCNPHEDMIDTENPLLVAKLYSEGLSTEEITIILGDELDESISEDTIIDSLKELGLMDGKTRDEQVEAFRRKNGRLN